MCARRFSPPRMMGRLNEPIKRQRVRFSWVGNKFSHQPTGESSKSGLVPSTECQHHSPDVAHLSLSHTHIKNGSQNKRDVDSCHTTEAIPPLLPPSPPHLPLRGTRASPQSPGMKSAFDETKWRILMRCLAHSPRAARFQIGEGVGLRGRAGWMRGREGMGWDGVPGR